MCMLNLLKQPDCAKQLNHLSECLCFFNTRDWRILTITRFITITLESFTLLIKLVSLTIKVGL